MTHAEIVADLREKNGEPEPRRVVLNCTKAELIEAIRLRVEWVRERIELRRRADEAGFNAFVERWGNTPIRVAR
jgi:hypothetical protein